MNAARTAFAANAYKRNEMKTRRRKAIREQRKKSMFARPMRQKCAR